MSKWTGKSDFCDLVEMHYSPEEILKSDVYINNTKIDFKNDPKNLIPYYPYETASYAASKDEDGVSHLTVFLYHKNYFQVKDEERLCFVIDELLKCKIFDDKAFDKIGDTCNVESEVVRKIYNKLSDEDTFIWKVLKAIPKKADWFDKQQFYKVVVETYLNSIHTETYKELCKAFADYCEINNLNNEPSVRQYVYE